MRLVARTRLGSLDNQASNIGEMDPKVHETDMVFCVRCARSRRRGRNQGDPQILCLVNTVAIGLEPAVGNAQH